MEDDTPTTAGTGTRSLEEEDLTDSREAKRLKTSHERHHESPAEHSVAPTKPRYDLKGILPPSLNLLDIESASDENGHPVTREVDVGISEYVSAGASKIEAIIKQRFTDFLVYEVDESGATIHLQSIECPSPTVGLKTKSGEQPALAPAPPPADQSREWTSEHKEKLESYFSEDALEELEKVWLEGANPPAALVQEEESTNAEPAESASAVSEVLEEPKSGRGRGVRGGRGGRGSRGGRGGRGGGRGGAPQVAEDKRRVTSQPIDEKDKRKELHTLIRTLFWGQLDSEAANSIGAEGPRIVVKWGGRGGRGGGRGGRSSREDRPPPYIHFTLHKTNRDTQDALSKLARSLNVNVKDLCVAGTKDKRGVTTQRVSLKRGRLLITDVWSMANGLRGRGRTEEQVVKERGERGIRIGDLEYKTGFLELGMLKGNCFVITLRNLRVDAPETVNDVMHSIHTKGFVNYYGMQRFGTASIPTHAIGLAILKSDWDLAISLLLRPRPGEHPEVEAGRRAFLEDGDLSQALDLIPRRCVAERCILEYYSKSKSRNALEALSKIPRNLRLMYVHAYQSYVWNAVVSERVRLHGCEKSVIGDLVYDKDQGDGAGMDVDVVEGASTEAGPSSAPAPNKGKKPQRGGKRPYVAPKIKVLSSQEDLDAYTIFDVIMPLPGRDVAYPGGQLGERYKEFLKLDGLDPDNLVHAQRDYTLLGSYRKVMHLPLQLSWSTLRYTDPDIALAQSDEDKILGLDPPVIEEHGRFMALQIQLQLGTAAYATMAIREITKMDTSSQMQAVLTQLSEDQKFKGGSGNAATVEIEGEGEDAEMPVAEDDGEAVVDMAEVEVQ